MSVSKPAWGGAGAWALAAEEEEKELAAAQTDLFPSLKEAVATKPKKKKNQPLSLAAFTSGAYNNNNNTTSKGLTHDELLQLPTGPRERSAEELDRSRGFRSYGGGGGGGGSRGGFDDDSRRQPRATEYDQPSRADETDNWSRDKKSFPPSDFRGQGQSRPTGTNNTGGFSRADETDDWARGKKPLNTNTSSFSQSNNRYSGGGFGSGFRDSPGSSDSDRWARSGPITQEPARERPRLVLNPPTKTEGVQTEQTRSNKPNPFGSARPREEILKEKGLDWRKMESEIESKGSSRPNSAHSSRPSSAHSSSSIVSDARPKVNPFGDAKPREVVLQEKGKDWRKIDLELEHKGFNRADTNEEKALKEELSFLKTELKETEAKKNPEETKVLETKILEMEKSLQLLTIETDSKIRYTSRPERVDPFAQRPGSGAGRVDPFGQRPGSGAGRVDPFGQRPGSGAGWVDPFGQRPGSGSGRVDPYGQRPGSGEGRVDPFGQRPGSGGGRVDPFGQRPGSGAGRVDPFGGESNNNYYNNNSERPESRGSNNREENKWGFQGGRDNNSSNYNRGGGSFAGRNSDRTSTRERW